MADGIYIAMGAARAQEHRLETLSNDLANANTTGYKTQETLYRQIHADITEMGSPNQAMDVDHPVRFLPEDRLPVVMDGRWTNFGQGNLRFTGNDLDLAINGNGFFELEGPNGSLYTRNGTFMLNRDGELVDQQGLPVLTRGGGRIRVPNEQGKVGITQDGSIIVDGEDVGQLSVVEVPNPQELKRVGNSNYELPNPEQKPPQMEEPDVRQQFTEGANVNAVHTMAMLIKTNRLFELNTRAIQAYKDMDDKAARDVGRMR